MPISNIVLSPNFKAQTRKSIFAIIIFILVYILLLLIAVGLAFLCAYGAYSVVISHPNTLTLFLALGLVSMGFLVLFFLIKSFFRTNKMDRSHLIEIFKEDQPQLFSLLEEIVNEIGTAMPKRVYLSSEVNASVFYDSNFWSMIFPIRKNLQLGLALTNVLTKAELTAILSHEFGHFSQKTMKVGSYVYNVNHIIHNMLYDNDSYDNLANKLAGSSGYISLFVIVALNIVKAIQWVLKGLYGFLNKSYMGLSREMEFHADEIAAHITGYEPLKNALLRMELADHSFNAVLGFYESKVSENLKSENLYIDHAFALEYLAMESKVPFQYGLPKITLAELNKFNKSKLVIVNQWASHPSTEERVKKLEDTDIYIDHLNSGMANDIFQDLNDLQSAITTRMFDQVQYSEPPSKIEHIEFQRQLKKEFKDNSFSDIYNGYYDSKNPICFDLEVDLSNYLEVDYKNLFCENKKDLIYTAISLENDIEIIKQIVQNVIPVKTFDYDGNKFKSHEGKAQVIRLNKELEDYNNLILENDKRIFSFARLQEQEQLGTNRILGMYKEFFAFDIEFNERFKISSDITNSLNFISYVTPFEEIGRNFLKIESLEDVFKDSIRTILGDVTYQTSLTPEIKDNFDLYISRKWRYFGSERYFDKNLEIMGSALTNYQYLLSKQYMEEKKKLLSYQELLLKKSQ